MILCATYQQGRAFDFIWQILFHRLCQNTKSMPGNLCITMLIAIIDQHHFLHQVSAIIRSCNSLSSGFQKPLPWIMCIDLVKIQASLYPNSEYLTNNESFHKEFDIYFPSQVHLHNFLVLLFPVVLLPVIIRIIISAIIISSTEFLSPVIGEIIRIIIIINIIRIAVCIV